MDCLKGNDSLSLSHLLSSERYARKYDCNCLNVRILLVFACPTGVQQLRLQHEERTIRESLRLGQGSNLKVDINVLPACTIDDFTTHLKQRKDNYDIIHFSGHTDRLNLLLRSIIESIKASNEQVDESSFLSVSVLTELENAVESFVSKFDRVTVKKLNPNNFLTTDTGSNEFINATPIQNHGMAFELNISHLAVTLKSGESSFIDFQKIYSYDELVDIGVGSLAFEAEGGRPVFVPTRAFADLISRQTHTKCVVLNACSSFVQADAMRSFVPMCVYFEGKVSDVESVSFSRGFYGAVAEGLDFERCFVEGRSRMQLCGYLPGVPVRPMGPSARCIVNMFLNEILMQQRVSSLKDDNDKVDCESVYTYFPGPSIMATGRFVGVAAFSATSDACVLSSDSLALENAELKKMVAMSSGWINDKDKEIRRLKDEKAQLIARFKTYATLGENASKVAVGGESVDEMVAPFNPTGGQSRVQLLGPRCATAKADLSYRPDRIDGVESFLGRSSDVAPRGCSGGVEHRKTGGDSCDTAWSTSKHFSKGFSGRAPIPYGGSPISRPSSGQIVRKSAAATAVTSSYRSSGTIRSLPIKKTSTIDRQSPSDTVAVASGSNGGGSTIMLQNRLASWAAAIASKSAHVTKLM